MPDIFATVNSQKENTVITIGPDSRRAYLPHLQQLRSGHMAHRRA